MSLKADIAAIKIRLDYFDTWAKKIDKRLADGDKRFHDTDVKEAAETARIQLATRVGFWALGVASAVGTWDSATFPISVAVKPKPPGALWAYAREDFRWCESSPAGDGIAKQIR